jgi:hypothetical protein
LTPDPRLTDPISLIKAQREKCAAQAARLLWLCAKDDAVFLPACPDKAFLACFVKNFCDF